IKRYNILLLILFFSPVCASYAWDSVLSLGAGTATSSNIGQSTNFSFLGANNFFNYSAKHVTQTSGMFDIFLGAERSIEPGHLAQLGIEYNQAAPFDAMGSLTQAGGSLFAIPDGSQQNPYYYHYNVQ